MEHSLHGLVSVRMVSAPPSIRERVRRRLGHSCTREVDDPDITIRFVDHLDDRGRLRFLGLNGAAFDDGYFYLLDDLGRRVRIDLGSVGGPCEILCEKGASPLFLLMPVIGLRLLRKGHVLLHSSSFTYGGKGILVCGWQKGGKTEMLLAFMAQGAEFMGNEWTIVSPAEGEIRGVGGVLQIWDWHLRHVPQYAGSLSDKDRSRLSLLRSFRSIHRILPRASAPRGPVGRWLRRVSLEGGVAQLGQVRVAPEHVFGDSVQRGPAALDRLFLATVGTGGTRVFPSDPLDVARRMSASQSYERRELIAAYEHFRFAFPDRRNGFLEDADEEEIRILSRAFSGTATYEITHPYPVGLGDLYSAAVPFCA